MTMSEADGNSEILRCPMHWGDNGGKCQRHMHHEPPCVFRHPTGALFVSARILREALALISSLDPHGSAGESARRTLQAIDRL